MKIKNDVTVRGFRINKFVDLSGSECSIQESSLATDYAIRIGMTEAKPIITAKKLRDDLTGCINYPVPDDVSIQSMMHLNREQVKELIPILQKFVDTGGI